ncbi:MAG: MBL fold metallo-hydrolase [Candidatus Jordarchaeales archaeon]
MSVDLGVGVRWVKITVLADNTVNPILRVDERFTGYVYHAGTAGCLGEHGLSLLLQVGTKHGTRTILFDTCGPKGTLINNMNELKVDPSSIEKVVVSHGHYDHFGSLIRLMDELSPEAEVILHPDVFRSKYVLRGELSGKDIRVSKETLEKLAREGKAAKLPQLDRKLVEQIARARKLRIVEATGPVELAPGVWASGEIPIQHREELSTGFYVEAGEKIMPDYFNDEKSIYVKVEGKGVIVLTGCCHKGLINTIEDAQRLSGERNVYAIIGGLHMIHASQHRINWTIEQLKEINPKIVSPLHCSGIKFTVHLLNRLPEKTIFSSVGTTFIL